MKCKLLALLTCFHALSPTASTCDMLTNYREAGGSAVLSPSVDTTPRHGLGDVPANASAIIAEFLAGIPTPTDAAGAREVVRRLAKFKPFVALRALRAVSRDIGELCKELSSALAGARQRALSNAITFLNDATYGVCDREGVQFRTEVNRMIQQIFDNYTDLSAILQAFSDLAQNLESLADAYKLLIKGSCEDPQATKHKLVRALSGASEILGAAGFSHNRAGNHAAAAQAHEKCAALHQRRAEIYGVLRNRESRVAALNRAASALLSAARSHTDAGNHAAAEEATRESARLRTEH